MMGSIASSAGGVFGGVLGKKAGHSIAKQLSSSKRESIENNFQELAAQDPSIHIIPYTEIMNLFMNKQKTLRTSYITIETSADKYKFASLELKIQTIFRDNSHFLGDKVIIEIDINYYMILYSQFMYRSVCTEKINIFGGYLLFFILKILIYFFKPFILLKVDPININVWKGKNWRSFANFVWLFSRLLRLSSFKLDLSSYFF
jgi:hypothetical protein